MSDEDAAVDRGGDAGQATAEPAQPEVSTSGTSGRRLPLSGLSPVRLATVLGLSVVVVLSLLCGWLGVQAYQAHKQAQTRALFLQVGRQAALNLTTIDYEKVDADVKRILESATGEFYDDFEKRSGPFADVVKKAQSKSVGTITEAAIESVSGDEAQVMVAAAVKSTNKAVQGEQPPRFWRMRIHIQKFGDEAKVSKVDFVP